MQNLPIVYPTKHKYYVLFATIIYSLCMGVMAISSQSITSFNYIGGLVVSILVSISIPIDAYCNCLFMTIPFTSVLKLPLESFGFMTLMQLVLIIRCIILQNSLLKPKYLIYIIFCCALTQLIPLIVYSQTLSNILLLCFNILTFYCVYKLTYKGTIEPSNVYISFAFGVIIAGFVSMRYRISVASIQDFRFCGLWTDPNFWGMFCLIGILSCIIAGFRKPFLLIIFVPMIIVLAISGFMTLSRTFVVVCGIMIICTTFRYLKGSFWGGLLIIIIFSGAVYYALPYAIEIFTTRSLDNENITNGRYENTAMILDYLFKHAESILFGFGYNNTLNAMHELHIGHGATHNTYTDLIIEFGLLWFIAFIFMIYKQKIKPFYIANRLFTDYGLIFLIILTYMGTLSMLKYAFLYLFAGVFIGNTKRLYT